MEFYVFTNLLVYLDRILSKENNSGNEDNSNEDMMNNYKNQMNKTKSDMFRNYKLPKIK